MPAKNVYHDAVVAALKADGWTITADPHRVSIGRRRLFVDLAGERAPVTADRGGERIAVEVQSFLRNSDIEDFHHAIGQYAVYRAILRSTDPGRELYLAVPDEVYTGIFSEPIGHLVVADLGMKVVVFHPTERRITQWIS
ncbi:fatty-acid oxidation protein subunit alpha : Fatty-acid oxidation protein subunit alpha OS=Candidatus Entotheonella sp. TSY1 GN=ETSY1_32380 PE=4 SV=1: XisH [Gemmataceae bacterium]|nr:fatty-acid oxidation protein subunit alpha : Fatty-acid oxidation protein subunit alpha OS=Candidatus Entotheonella sp. TSY1 GN=ETSY1_32380 PE=4 SV=1: XisH [Gemmataceae bacterium]VTU01275.1 fatty-acid oxidation protein subunit alpha : Fatty-acid oxidation protein subunit alpha OS=Candidatus Entotheonella sp. TSY1 GN=ETSY1_32380 PE=4 SV=1: XisH [Gemmataceae bacterium]